MAKKNQPIPSAVEVAENLTKTEASAPVKQPALFVWSSLQYGIELSEKGGALFVPALANGLPAEGDKCSINRGDGFFQPSKIVKAEQDGDSLILELVAE